jgi:hypothetical protein
MDATSAGRVAQHSFLRDTVRVSRPASRLSTGIRLRSDGLPNHRAQVSTGGRLSCIDDRQ